MTDALERIDREVARRESGDAKEPLHLARLIHQRYPGLVRWQGQFWQWQGGAYVGMTDDAIRTGIYSAIDDIGQTPTRTKVSDTLDALRAVAFTDDTIEPPCWLSTGATLEPGTVAVRNGVLDIVSGELSPPSPDLFTLAALPVEFDPDADCPQWRKFLRQLWPDDEQAIDALRDVFGYLVAGDTSHQKVVLMVGPKRAGKGTILRILTALLGRANVAAPTLGSLAGPFGLQSLIGKSAALISDARLSGRADQEAIAERLLSISGEDHVSVPRKFLPDYTAQIGARFVLATNELPRLHDASGALASRFVPLVLTRSWYGREDRHLSDRLMAELPGILNWAMEGYRRLSARGHFVIPDTAADAMQELQDLGSPIGAFLRDECVIEAGAEVACAHLYGRWCEWCEEHGRNHPGTEQSFGRDLRAAAPGVQGTQVRREGQRVRVYRGIRRLHPGECHAPSRSRHAQEDASRDAQSIAAQGLEGVSRSVTHTSRVTREENTTQSNEHNGVARVTSRDTCPNCDGEGCDWCA